MRVFLTGGTGFIGHHLTRSLLGRGWSVTALVRKPDSPRAMVLGKIGAQLAAGDIMEPESMRAWLRGADLVVHAAGLYEFGLDAAGKKRMRSVNVEGTENVLGLAHALNAPRTIYISTQAAFGETGPEARDETFTRQAPYHSFYEQSKTEAHAIARQFQERGLPLIIVCPNPVIGVNDHSIWGYFVRLYVNRLLPPMAWGPDTLLCCEDVHDVAEGLTLAAEKGRPGETYMLAGEPHTFRQIFAWWGKKPGAFVPRLWLPAGLMAAMLAPMEPLQRWLGLPAFLSRETVRSGTNFNFSNAKAKRELGWTPRPAETLWLATVQGEIDLLAKRKGQSLIQRLKPLESVD